MDRNAYFVYAPGPVRVQASSEILLLSEENWIQGSITEPQKLLQAQMIREIIDRYDLPTHGMMSVKVFNYAPDMCAAMRENPARNSITIRFYPFQVNGESWKWNPIYFC